MSARSTATWGIFWVAFLVITGFAFLQLRERKRLAERVSELETATSGGVVGDVPDASSTAPPSSFADDATEREKRLDARLAEVRVQLDAARAHTTYLEAALMRARADAERAEASRAAEAARARALAAGTEAR